MSGNFVSLGGGFGATTPDRFVTPVDYATQVLGSIIPISSGRRVVDGALIWASPITRELRVGFPGINTSLAPVSGQEFHGDFAIAFGYPLAPADEREAVGVVRLWANGTLIYDATGLAGVNAFSDVRFTVHGAEEDQLPDGTIFADKGDLTSGYPDMIYVVFTGFNLTPYQGKIPAIRAELADSLTVENTIEEFTTLAAVYPGPYGGTVDWSTGQVWFWQGNPFPDPRTLHEYSFAAPYEAADLNEVRSTAITSGGTMGEDECWFVDQQMHIGLAQTGGSNTRPTVLFDLDEHTVLETFGASSADTSSDSDGVGAVGSQGCMLRTKENNTERRAFALNSFVPNELTLLQYATDGEFSGVVYSATDAAGKYKMIYSGEVGDVCSFPYLDRPDLSQMYYSAQGQDATLFVAEGATLWQLLVGCRGGLMEFRDDYGSSTVAGLQKWMVYTGYTIRCIIVDQSSYGLNVFLTHDISGDWYLSRIETSTGRGQQGSSDATDSAALGHRGAYVFPKSTEASGNPFPHAFQAKESFRVVIPDMNFTGVYRNSLRQARTTDGRIGYPVSGANEFAILNLKNGTYRTIAVTSSWFGSGRTWFYDGQEGVVVVPGNGGGSPKPAVLRINVATSTGSPLSDVLRWISLRSGYAEADIDVDAALTDAIDGTNFSKEYATAALWRDMGALYDFLTFESEGKIKFVRRARGITDLVATLTVDELAPISEGTAFGTESVLTRLAAPINVPSGVALSYIDPVKDFTYSQVFANQSSVVDGSNSSKTQVAIEVPIVMDAEEAFDRAAKVTVDAQQMGSMQQFRVSQEFFKLEPSDVVTLVTNSYSYVVRISTITYNADWSISVTAPNNAFSRALLTNGDGVLGDLPQTVPSNSDSRPVIFDIPLLSYLDDIPNVIVTPTAIASLGQPGWQASTMFQASVPTDFYNAQYRTDVDAPYGVCQEVLPVEDQPWYTDEATELTVTLRSATSSDFESTDADGLDQGRNCVVVGKQGRWEYIYFRDVTVVNPKVVTLTGLRRGRRGTDVNCSNHIGGDFVYLLRSVAADFSDPVRKLTFEPAQAGDSFMFKAVGDVNTISPMRVEVELVGGSLMPWAPVSFTVTLETNGDLTFDWVRRTRLNGPLEELTGDVPLDEATEAYELDIYDEAGTTLVRTITAVTNTATYTEAMQTEDGVEGGLDVINATVYQMSADVGRGYGRELAFTLDRDTSLLVDTGVYLLVDPANPSVRLKVG